MDLGLAKLIALGVFLGTKELKLQRDLQWIAANCEWIAAPGVNCGGIEPWHHIANNIEYDRP